MFTKIFFELYKKIMIQYFIFQNQTNNTLIALRLFVNNLQRDRNVFKDDRVMLANLTIASQAEIDQVTANLSVYTNVSESAKLAIGGLQTKVLDIFRVSRSTMIANVAISSVRASAGTLQLFASFQRSRVDKVRKHLFLNLS